MTSTAPAAAPPAAPAIHGTDWRPVVGVSLGLVTLLTVLVSAFTWPASEVEPRGLPLAVAAPAEAAGGMRARLAEAAGPDAFELTTVPDREAAVAAIQDREVYAAMVAGPEGVELLVSSAASPAVAQMLTQQAAQMGVQPGSQPAAQPGAQPGAAQITSPTVTDVVPSPESDPRGTVFGAGALPLALGGIAVGAVTSLALRRTRDRLLAAALVGLGGGLALVGVLQGWLGALEGDYWSNAGVAALGIWAVALPIIGLRHLMGPAGIGLVALLVLLVGNPLSGVTSAPQLLPLGWLGQLLPPGAVGSALRGTAFFDGAGTMLPLTVLACWALAGLVLALVPRRETSGQVTAGQEVGVSERGAHPGGPKT